MLNDFIYNTITYDGYISSGINRFIRNGRCDTNDIFSRHNCMYIYYRMYYRLCTKKQEVREGTHI